jgi:DnaK suppressor protein
VTDVRAQLLLERAAALGRIAGLSTDIEEVISAAASVSTDDEHDPEGATIAFERSQLGALRDQAQRHVIEVDEALARLDAGTYGSCVVCGRPIGTERLAARPSASACIACAR